MCSVDGIELFFRNCLVRHVLGTRTFADGSPGLTSAGDRSQHPRMRVAGMVGSLGLEHGTNDHSGTAFNQACRLGRNKTRTE